MTHTAPIITLNTKVHIPQSALVRPDEIGTVTRLIANGQCEVTFSDGLTLRCYRYQLLRAAETAVEVPLAERQAAFIAKVEEEIAETQAVIDSYNTLPGEGLLQAKMELMLLTIRLNNARKGILPR